MSVSLFEKIEPTVVAYAYLQNFCHACRFITYLERDSNPTDYLDRDGTAVRTSYGCLYISLLYLQRYRRGIGCFQWSRPGAIGNIIENLGLVDPQGKRQMARGILCVDELERCLSGLVEPYTHLALSQIHLLIVVNSQGQCIDKLR